MVRRGRVRIVLAATAAAIAMLLTIARPVPAFAAQIVQPAGSRIVAALDASGVPVAVTVVANGFAAGSLVYVEQCDGVAVTTASWSPTVHCDLGSSPSPAIVDVHGVATFTSTDRNRAFRPFIGESPQSLFNCLAPGQRAPANSLPNFSNCKLRVSTSNTAVTADQTFVPVLLTTTRTITPTTLRPATTTKGTAIAKAQKAPTASSPRSKRPLATDRTSPADAVSVSIAAGHGPGVGLLSFSDANLSTGYILVLGGLLVAGLTITLRRRNPAPRRR
jgi:hypothetical protein